MWPHLPNLYVGNLAPLWESRRFQRRLTRHTVPLLAVGLQANLTCLGYVLLRLYPDRALLTKLRNRHAERGGPRGQFPCCGFGQVQHGVGCDVLRDCAVLAG